MDNLPDYAQSLFANQGTTVLTWILGLVALLGARLLAMITTNKATTDAFRVLALHARDAVQATFQVYVEAIKKGRADGKLTPEEAAEAKRQAIAALRARLTWKQLASLGGGILAKIFLGDKWTDKVEKMLGTAVEVSIADEKKLGKAMSVKSTGVDAPHATPAAAQDPQ